MKALDLHNYAMTVAGELKDKYIEMFDVLLMIEKTKAYHALEIISLHVYCVEMLQISPHVAFDFIQVVRKAIELPKLADAVRSRSVTISKARKICPVIDANNVNEWIALARECSCRVVEKAVAMAKPRTTVIESAKYVSADTLEFKLAVSEEWVSRLKETKDLLSQKLNVRLHGMRTTYIMRI